MKAVKAWRQRRARKKRNEKMLEKTELELAKLNVEMGQLQLKYGLEQRCLDEWVRQKNPKGYVV